MKIAIIGGGIAGLTAAYYLNKKHDITLFEKSNRVGGNAYVHHSSEGYDLDASVFAFTGYGTSNFSKLLMELGVKCAKIPDVGCCVHDLNTLSTRKFSMTLSEIIKSHFNQVRLSNIKLLYQLTKAKNEALRKLESNELKDLTLSELFSEIRYFTYLPSHLFTLAFCLLTSMSYNEVLNSPAEFFIKDLVRHDFNSIKGFKTWFCMKNNVNDYINALVSHFPNKIKYSTPVLSISRKDKIRIKTKNNEEYLFDKVVFACNSDQILPILSDPTDLEKELLGSIKYKDGRLVVHRDHSSFPKRNLIAGYTYLTNGNNTSINGCAWYQPSVPNSCDCICSQHPNFSIKKDLIEFDTIMRTPMYDFKSYEAVKNLYKLNNKNNSYFCGSYCGYGLHEDAVTSAINILKYI